MADSVEHADKQSDPVPSVTRLDFSENLIVKLDVHRLSSRFDEQGIGRQRKMNVRAASEERQKEREFLRKRFMQLRGGVAPSG
jgi:hypothetical protein